MLSWAGKLFTCPVSGRHFLLTSYKTLYGFIICLMFVCEVMREQMYWLKKTPVVGTNGQSRSKDCPWTWPRVLVFGMKCGPSMKKRMIGWIQHAYNQRVAKNISIYTLLHWGVGKWTSTDFPGMLWCRFLIRISVTDYVSLFQSLKRPNFTLNIANDLSQVFESITNTYHGSTHSFSH